MKALILSFSFFVSLTVFAKEAPSCLNQPNVAADAPYLLTLSELTTDQADGVLEQLQQDQTLSFQLIFGVGTVKIYTITVKNPDFTDAVVMKKVEDAIQMYSVPEQNWALECNGVHQADF